jgi:hypothetical protein
MSNVKQWYFIATNMLASVYLKSGLIRVVAFGGSGLLKMGLL